MTKYTLYSTCCYVPAYIIGKYPAPTTTISVIGHDIQHLDGTPVKNGSKVVCPKCDKPFKPSRANIKGN